MKDGDLLVYEELSKNKKVVAIGEIGIDYHYDYSPRDVQKKRFIEQMDLAMSLKMPVIIHDREAHEDCLNIVKKYKGLKGVYHCYSGSPEMAREILDLGWYISFTGSITFKNAKKALEVIKMMPPDRIMIETDSPYLAPEPFRGKRNDSTNIRLVAEKIANVRGMTTTEVAELTTENGKRFFGIEL